MSWNSVEGQEKSGERNTKKKRNSRLQESVGREDVNQPEHHADASQKPATRAGRRGILSK